MALRGIASTPPSGFGTTVTVTVSSIGIQAGDVVLLLVNNGAEPSTFTFPTGFGAITGLSPQQICGDSMQAMQMKIATGSEPTSYTITASTADYKSAECRVYSGRSGTVTAAQITATTFSGTSPVAMTMTALTAAAGDDIVIFTCQQLDDGTHVPTYTPPTGYANGSLIVATINPAPIFMACDKVNTAAGSSGTSAGTFTVAGGATNWGWGTMALSLAAATTTSNNVCIVSCGGF